MPTRKVVILHDWLTGYRGGERVLEAICELFPEAPIYTLIHKKGSTSPFLESRKIITSWMDKIPGIHEKYRYFLPLMPLATKSLQIDPDTDLLISSSHCVIKGVSKPPHARHISYIHSPMRYMYDQFENYFGKSNPIVKMAAHALKPYLRTWDYITNDNVDTFIANSSFVRSRIKNFYNRDSLIIHPFVDLKDFTGVQRSPPLKENYYVMVTAFAPNKRVDLAIRTFNDLGKELRIIGFGSKEEEQALRGMSGPHIKFLGAVPRAEVVEQLSKAKALIFPGIEDFGIVPLESLASGTPVIAYKLGGVLDTLNTDCAVFFEELSEESLKNAVQESTTRNFHSSVLIEQASRFSKKRFQDQFLALVES